MLFERCKAFVLLENVCTRLTENVMIFVEGCILLLCVTCTCWSGLGYQCGGTHGVANKIWTSGVGGSTCGYCARDVDTVKKSAV